MLRCALAALVLVAPAVHAAETMRIAVGEPSAQAVVQGEGLTLGPDEDGAARAALGEPRAVVTLAADGLRVNGKPVDLPVVRLRGDDALVANGVPVRGEVVVLPWKGRLQVVNVLPLEDYLVGVLGSEMPVSFPPEALKAQAIAARTYALRKKLDGLGQPWHLGSSVISQVYSGLKAEDPRTRAAVEATHGVVLTWQLQPIEAYFHASCGGRTESGLEALGRALPYLRPVECPCGSLPTSRWTALLPGADVQRALGTKPTALSVQGRSPTGRARRVELAPGRAVNAVTFRERLGYGRVKSLAFEAEKKGDGWLLTGTGFGHGAGLCQWGARTLADRGLDAVKILEHYYPGTALQTLY